MFSLLFGFWQYLFSRPNIHILLIGLDNAGKTTILEKIKALHGKNSLPPEKIPPTIGMNLAKLQVRGSQIIIWDLGGQIKMRNIWEKYYTEANVVIFVVDSADVGRLDEAKMAYDATCEHEGLKQVPVMTFANKQDLPVN
jgi:ADP-ribosylation factor related protein 1